VTELITIGKIIRHQGNKGEVRVEPLTDYPERYDLLQKVYLKKDDTIMEKNIEKVSYRQKFIVIKFEGIDDIQSSKFLKDHMIKIEEDELLELEEDNFYIYQILNFRVETVEGDFLGNLFDVKTTGGTDVFVVKSKRKEYMIPASKEIIKRVDLEKELIIVDPLPGLLDL